MEMLLFSPGSLENSSSIFQLTEIIQLASTFESRSKACYQPIPTPQICTLTAAFLWGLALVTAPIGMIVDVSWANIK